MKLSLKVYVASAFSGALIAFNPANSASLKAEDPEYLQLEAMGYEISSDGEAWSVVRWGTDYRFSVSKDPRLTQLCNIFSFNAPASQERRLKALDIINKVNDGSMLQYVLKSDTLTACFYIVYPHQRRPFAELIKIVENAGKIFDEHPELLEVEEKK